MNGDTAHGSAGFEALSRVSSGIRPFVRRVVHCLACTTLLLPAACVDFIEPEIPNRSTPTRLDINLRVFDHGLLQVDGTLTPGRDSLGFLRAVQSPFVHAAGRMVEPQSMNAAGVRSYTSVFDIARGETVGPFDMIGPGVHEAGELPPLLWYGLRRLDPDTLRPAPGADIVLHMDTAAARSDPDILFRQWFLEVRSGITAFRLSGDATPPLTLRIPAEWVPPAANGRATITMIYYQIGQLRSPPGAYVANVTLDTRLHWVVAYGDASPTGTDPP